jgi:hypothetical protein
MVVKRLLVLLAVFTINNFSFAQEAKMEFVKSFMKDMSEMNDLNKYVLNSQGYTIDFYLIDEYEISGINNNVVTVDINTGGNKSWTRLHFEIVEVDGKLYFKGKHIEKRKIISPWFFKEEVAPPN